MAYTKLREIRNKKGLSAEELARILGLKTVGAYYKKESGATKFSLAEAKLISEKLNQSIEKIFFDEAVSIIETNKSNDATTLSATGTE
ncbi:MAG: helix-turn-helix transcriptional regulator [Firmicutes bacterium]|nr:helix-turn-helix transcriptional regulator [Bacillota bacterium]